MYPVQIEYKSRNTSVCQSRTQNSAMHSSSTQKSHTRQTNFHPSSAPPPHVSGHSTSCAQISVLEELREAKWHQIAIEGDKSTHICIYVYQNAFWTFWMFQVSLKMLNQSTETHENQWQSYLYYFEDRLSGKPANYILQCSLFVLNKDLENLIPVSNGHHDALGTPNPKAASKFVSRILSPPPPKQQFIQIQGKKTRRAE